MRNGLQQANHRNADAGRLDEFPLRLEHPLLFAVESDDETGGDVEPVSANPGELFQRVPRDILHLLRGLEQLGVRGLDADEDVEETGLDHALEQLIIVGQIDRSFGVIAKRIIVPAVPGSQLSEHGMSFAFLLLPMKLSSTKKM